MRNIDYYFTTMSPWSFLGHARFMEVARANKAQVSFFPVLLAPVFAETGGLPLQRRAPQRQRYRMLELQRWRVKRQIDFHLVPKFWPFDPLLADQLIVAALQAGHDVESLVARLFSGVWQRQENLADPATLIAIADEVGLPGADLVAAASGAEAKSGYDANQQKAIAADVFGAPSYVLDGEVFWGQDRVELLADALASGRPPFVPVPLP